MRIAIYKIHSSLRTTRSYPHHPQLPKPPLQLQEVRYRARRLTAHKATNI